MLDDIDDKDLRLFLRNHQSKIFYNGSTVDFLQSMKVHAYTEKWVLDKHLIFLSFSGPKRSFATNIFNFLKDSGYKTWIDQEVRGEGKIVSETIRKAISITKIFVAIVGEEYDDDKLYQSRENHWVKVFNEEKRDNEQIVVLTIAIGKVNRENLPEMLNSRFWLQLPNDDLTTPDAQQGLERLLNEIKSLI